MNNSVMKSAPSGATLLPADFNPARGVLMVIDGVAAGYFNPSEDNVDNEVEGAGLWHHVPFVGDEEVALRLSVDRGAARAMHVIVHYFADAVTLSEVKATTCPAAVLRCMQPSEGDGAWTPLATPPLVGVGEAFQYFYLDFVVGQVTHRTSVMPLLVAGPDGSGRRAVLTHLMAIDRCADEPADTWWSRIMQPANFLGEIAVDKIDTSPVASEGNFATDADSEEEACFSATELERLFRGQRRRSASSTAEGNGAVLFGGLAATDDGPGGVSAARAAALFRGVRRRPPGIAKD